MRFLKSFPYLAILMLAAIPGCGCEHEVATRPEEDSDLAVRVLAEGLRLDGTHSHENSKFTPQDFARLKAYCLSHPDPSAFPALMILYAHAAAEYQSLSPKLRSTILCRALRHELTLADFGHLPQGSEPESQNGLTAMKALLDADHAENFKLLFYELDDRMPVDFFGSSDATTASRLHYRHCDFAAWACYRMLGDNYILKTNLEERNQDIEILKTRLLKEGHVKSATPTGM